MVALRVRTTCAHARVLALVSRCAVLIMPVCMPLARGESNYSAPTITQGAAPVIPRKSKAVESRPGQYFFSFEDIVPASSSRAAVKHAGSFVVPSVIHVNLYTMTLSYHT